MEPLELDADDDSSDWIKAGRWDIPASNVDELRTWLALVEWPVESFKRSAVYRAHLTDKPWLSSL